MSGAHIWQTQPEEITDIYAEETADVVVVGAGQAGVVAAQSAAEAGASVICAEKFGKPTAHGTDIGSINTLVHEREGVYIDPKEAARLEYQWSQQQANFHLIRTYTKRSGEVLNHYIRMAEARGVTVKLNAVMTARADWNELDEKYRMFRTAHIFEAPEGIGFPKERWNAAYFQKVVYDSALELGVKFLFNAPAVRLIREEGPDGRVTGVIAKDAQGYKKLNARKGVILATGGITDSREMKECFCPIALRADKVENFPVGGNNGDGLVMGKWIGAAFSRCYPAPIIHPVNFDPLCQGMNTSWLAVDRNGKRFCNETAWEPIVTNARMNAPGNVAWSVWDSDYAEHYRHQEPSKYAAEAPGFEERMEAAVESGSYVRRDTIAELAEAIGVPPANLAATVARYNELVDAGYDEDFGVPERFLSPVKRGPFYAGKISAWLLTLPYGLHVDDNSQVCTDDDDPIPGLYAVGNVQGDFFANSYPVTLPGSSHGRSICFGRLVGLMVAEGRTEL